MIAGSAALVLNETRSLQDDESTQEGGPRVYSARSARTEVEAGRVHIERFPIITAFEDGVDLLIAGIVRSDSKLPLRARAPSDLELKEARLTREERTLREARADQRRLLITAELIERDGEINRRCRPASVMDLDVDRHRGPASANLDRGVPELHIGLIGRSRLHIQAEVIQRILSPVRRLTRRDAAKLRDIRHMIGVLVPDAARADPALSRTLIDRDARGGALRSDCIRGRQESRRIRIVAPALGHVQHR